LRSCGQTETLAGEESKLAVKQRHGNHEHALATGERIEMRGFGTFRCTCRRPRQGRNPKTGEAVALAGSTSRTSSRAKTCVSGSTTVRISRSTIDSFSQGGLGR